MTNPLQKIATWSLVMATLMGSGVSYGKIYLFHIVLVFTLAMMLISYRQESVAHIQVFMKKNWELLGIVFILCISLFWSIKLSGGIIYISYWLMGLTLMLVASFLSSKNQGIFLNAGLAFLIIHGVISLFEYAGIFRMPLSEYSNFHSAFGKDVQFSERKLLSLKNSQHLSTGFFWNPNNSALYCLLALPFITLIKNIFIKISLLVFSVVIIYSTSSDAILGITIIYLLARVSLIGFNKLTRLQKKNVIIAVGTISFAALLWFFFSYQNTDGDTFLPKIRGFVYIIPKFIMAKITGQSFDINLVQEAIRERFFWLSSSIDLIKESYGFGIGAGRIKSIELFFEDRYMKMESIHFYWLEIMMVGGVLSFVLFFKWYFKILKDLCLQKNNVAKMCLHAMILLLPGAIVLSSAVYYLPMYLLFGISLGCRGKVFYD